MKTLKIEIEKNHDSFFNKIENSVADTFKNLSAEKSVYLKSYERISTLQAWKSDLLSSTSSEESLGFFNEAHNDAVMSYCLARQGAWRMALICLRSALENVAYFLYYIDHPVELTLWESGKHRLGFSETIAYLGRHPSFDGHKDALTGIELAKREYRELSKAVHASAKSFRVTSSGDVVGLHNTAKRYLGMWTTRESNVIISINRLLLTFFKNELHGTKNSNLRKSISLAIPATKAQKDIKSEFSVILKSSG